MSNEKNLERLQDWAGRVACPVCFGVLAVTVAHATCAGCSRVYPVSDGIPVLIADRTVTSPTAT
ncbi:MAG: hypothetical protein P4L40_18115 [Terracidiphilus sp.]|nr:hypothetical protein [Terracidiphilus sp.]